MAIKISEFISKKELMRLVAGSMTLQELFNGTPGTFLDKKLKEYLQSEPLDKERGEDMSAIMIYMEKEQVMLAHITFDNQNKPVRNIRETPLKQFGDFVEDVINKKAAQPSTPQIESQPAPEQLPEHPTETNGTQEQSA